MNRAFPELAPQIASVCPDIGLREETAADADFLAGVYAETRQQELSVVAWSDAEKQTFLRSQFDLQSRYYRTHYPGAELLIVQRGGEPIGRLYLYRERGEIRLMDIALASAWRGRGIGAHLLAALRDAATRDHCAITLHVEPNNPARAWYERLGFSVIEERGIYLFMSWQPFSVHVPS